jgi:uncharacterized protein (TIGR03066 family)
MRFTPLALAFLIAAPTLAHAASDDELKKMLIGRWGESSACTDSVLLFKEDGSFTMSSDSEDPDSDMAGTYQIKAGVLTGSAEDRDMPAVTLRFEGGDKVYLEADGKTTDTLIRCSADAAQDNGGDAAPAEAAPAPAPEPAPAQ